MLRKILASFALFVGLTLASVSLAHASEGVFNLRNIVGENARCTSYSVLMQDNNFNILTSCRDILYPGGTSVFNYVLWATPIGGGNPFRLGTLGLGKVFYKTKTPFANLFVTKETEERPRNPVGPTVMSGSLEVNSFLDKPSSATPASPTTGSELGEPVVTPTPSPTPAAGGSNIGRIFAFGGVLGLIALFGVVLVIFVLTRRR